MSSPEREADMDQNAMLQEVQSWPLDDQLDFLFHAWDRLVERGWRPELTDDLKAELDRRLAANNLGVAMTRRLTAIIQREEDGYVALCPELDIASQGDTIEVARDNLR